MSRSVYSKKKKATLDSQSSTYWDRRIQKAYEDGNVLLASYLEDTQGKKKTTKPPTIADIAKEAKKKYVEKVVQDQIAAKAAYKPAVGTSGAADEETDPALVAAAVAAGTVGPTGKVYKAPTYTGDSAAPLARERQDATVFGPARDRDQQIAAQQPRRFTPALTSAPEKQDATVRNRGLSGEEQQTANILAERNRIGRDKYAYDPLITKNGTEFYDDGKQYHAVHPSGRVYTFDYTLANPKVYDGSMFRALPPGSVPFNPALAAELKRQKAANDRQRQVEAKAAAAQIAPTAKKAADTYNYAVSAVALANAPGASPALKAAARQAVADAKAAEKLEIDTLDRANNLAAALAKFGSKTKAPKAPSTGKKPTKGSVIPPLTPTPATTKPGSATPAPTTGGIPASLLTPLPKPVPLAPILPGKPGKKLTGTGMEEDYGKLMDYVKTYAPAVFGKAKEWLRKGRGTKRTIKGKGAEYPPFKRPTFIGAYPMARPGRPSDIEVAPAY